MNANAYNDCVRNLSDSLYRFACKCIGNGEDAQDVVQGCFEVLWEKKDSVSPEKAKAFLFQVAYNQSVDVFRKSKRIQYPERPPEHLMSTASQPGLKKALDQALATLGPQARALVLLKDYEGYSYEEIGRLTDLSESQVKVYLFRARKTLKEYLVNIENVL